MQFEAEVKQVRTIASDFTVNVTLNLPEYQLAEAKELMSMIGDLVLCEIHLVGEIVDDKPAKKSRRNVS